MYFHVHVGGGVPGVDVFGFNAFHRHDHYRYYQYGGRRIRATNRHGPPPTGASYDSRQSLVRSFETTAWSNCRGDNNSGSVTFDIVLLALFPLLVFVLLAIGYSALFGRRNSSEYYQQQQQQQQQRRQSSPPAKPYLLEEFPTVSVGEEEMSDPVRSSCPVCLVDFQLGEDNVKRMPCSHLYHEDCLGDWLLKACTCPVCRYELPTDDDDYERGRIHRMKDRKPRYWRYELNRMSPRQLKSLVHGGGSNNSHYNSAVEKNDLIEYLITSRSIELIPSSKRPAQQLSSLSSSSNESRVTPPPTTTRYSRKDLSGMTIKQLKCALRDVGVSLENRIVVEKEDLLELFPAEYYADNIVGTHDDEATRTLFEEEYGTTTTTAQQQQKQHQKHDCRPGCDDDRGAIGAAASRPLSTFQKIKRD